MNKLIAYLLAIVINVHSLGALWFYVDIQCQRSNTYAHILHNCPPQKYLTILELSTEQQSADFKWMNTWEIKYKGELYDVVKTVQNGKTTRFLCVWDQHEKLLHQALEKQVNQQIPVSGESSAILHQLFEKQWVHHSLLVPSFALVPPLEAYINPFYNRHFVSHHAEVIPPPPQKVLV